MRASLNFLKLVYPPISNQFGEWLSEEAEVRQFVKRSKLYMLAQRHEVLFQNYRVDESSGKFCFDLSCGNTVASGLSVEIAALQGDFEEEFEIQAGERSLKLLDCRDMKGEPVYWATTDKLLYDFWRRRIVIHGLDNVLPFTKYNLYYVGISKEHDSFTRLFDSGHKSRLKILSNETQLTSTARLTDELYIFLFDVEDLVIKVLEEDDFTLPASLDKKKLIADAEKAFVSVLDCKYNEVKYKDYPAGRDGLAHEGLTRYGYVIDEDITFIAPDVEIRGAYGVFLRTRDPDMIFIAGDSVTLESSTLPTGEGDAYRVARSI